MKLMNSQFEWRGWMRRVSLTVLAGAIITTSGCRKAEVERISDGAVVPALNAGDAAYILRPKNEAKTPWYRDFQVVFEDRPEDEKQLDEYVAAHRGPVQE